ncbi:STAS domain-containing protein [Enhygromyxa salina]|uniref:RsbT co-antagonist protein RsbRA n=1 Tax=Enhygromyxa salina TaxID=215803 RepID=A0A2S9YM92_9BACT|nr:STAS domain-containing protein [Enhygromyxa salina]PRQ06209.1 RsbT co-antagonist protein RsbRA [Enhygromyxa salina]
MSAATGNPNEFEIDGVRYTWDRERDLMLMNDMPVAALLVESTLAGMMWGVERMVGRERFELAMQAAGRSSIEGEWLTFISQMPAPEVGVAVLGSLTPLGGLGRWQVVEFDHARKFAVFRVTAGFEPIYQKSLGVEWGSSFLAGKFAGYCTKAFGTHCWAEQTRFNVRGDEFDEFEVRPSDRSVEDRLDAMLFTAESSAVDLAAALERLRREVEERSAVEARLREEAEVRRRVEDELRGKLETIERQAEDIRALSTPILQVWTGVLTVPVIGRLDSQRAEALTEALLTAVVDRRARTAILDLTGAEALDAAALNSLLRLARTVSLLGARCMVSGMSPQAARIAVDLGIDLSGLAAHATLEAALHAAIRAMENASGAGGQVTKDR